MKWALYYHLRSNIASETVPCSHAKSKQKSESKLDMEWGKENQNISWRLVLKNVEQDQLFRPELFQPNGGIPYFLSF